MLVTRGVLASANALVHPSIASPDERDRHAAFLAHTLALTFAACAVAPFFLAFHGVPTPAESVLFALALVQVGAATLVVRSGRLAQGHRLSFAGLVGVGIVLFVGLRAGAGVAVAWLVAAQIEAVASFDRRLINEATLATGAALLAIVVASFDGRFVTRLPEGSAAGLAALAFVAAASALRRMTAAVSRLHLEEIALAARSRAIDAAIGAPIVTLDAGGSVRSLSRTDPHLLDAPDHDLLGRGLFDLVHVADRPAYLKLIDDASQGPDTAVGVLRLRGWAACAVGEMSDQRYRTVELRAHRLSTAAATSTGDRADVVAVLRDVMDQNRRDQAIEESQRSVEETLRSKDLFLTTMSHELRTPLNAIIGFSELLASRTARPGDVAKQCEFARTINQSGRHLLGLINSVIDMSRLQMGAFPISPEPFDVGSLLDQACETVKAQADEMKVRLGRDYPADLEEVVGDKRALKQALVALLSNAVKFTPEHGLVTLAARPEGTALVITVVDTGVGIAAEDLPRVGDPFFQSRASFARSYEGAGLGLALARGLLGLHGGTLAIASRLGQGTVVSIKLPLDCNATTRASVQSAIETLSPRPSRRHIVHLGKDAA